MASMSGETRLRQQQMASKECTHTPTLSLPRHSLYSGRLAPANTSIYYHSMFSQQSLAHSCHTVSNEPILKPQLISQSIPINSLLVANNLVDHTTYNSVLSPTERICLRLQNIRIVDNTREEQFFFQSDVLHLDDLSCETTNGSTISIQFDRSETGISLLKTLQ